MRGRLLKTSADSSTSSWNGRRPGRIVSPHLRPAGISTVPSKRKKPARQIRETQLGRPVGGRLGSAAGADERDNRGPDVFSIDMTHAVSESSEIETGCVILNKECPPTAKLPLSAWRVLLPVLRLLRHGTD